MILPSRRRNLNRRDARPKEETDLAVWRTLAAAVALCVGTGASSAATVVDASYQASSESSRLITGPVFQQVAQTFTVERSGIFASVVLPLRHERHYPLSQDLRVSLMSVVGGLPSLVLASVDVKADVLDGPEIIDLPVDFSFARQFVRRGDVFAIAAGAINPANYGTGNYIWQADSPGGYAGGIAPVIFQPAYAAAFGLPTGWTPSSDWDMGFTTYVAPIALPGSLQGLIAAFSVLGLLAVSARARSPGQGKA